MAFAVPVWLAVQAELLQDDEPEVEDHERSLFDAFDDDALFEHFHLTRPCVDFVMSAVRERMKTAAQKKPCPPVDAVVMLALNYFAHGAFAPTVVERVSPLLPTGLTSVTAMAAGIIAGMSDVFLSFPQTPHARAQTSSLIQEYSGISDVLGILAPAHFKIRASPYEKESFKSFINAAGFTSVVSQFICDSLGNILSVEKCCVGSTSEQEIWDSSFKGREVKEEVHGSYWFVAGAGYQLSKHVLTAVDRPGSDSEDLFNEAHAKTLGIMRDTLGLLKRRFRCLMQLGFTAETSLNKKSNIIKACSVLHNIALKFSVPAPAASEKTETLCTGIQLRKAPIDPEAREARQRLINKSFPKH